MHWCADETAAAMTVLGSLSLVLTWLKVKGARAWAAMKRLLTR